jgi:polysaccharide deacetylase family protein (PEP-CTERM system associated)
VIRNALSVDLEEYYHGMEFEAAVPPQERSRLPSRVEESTQRVLDVLEKADVRATFFVVGSVAEARPALVRRIADLGHEIACHSYRHELVHRQGPEEFRRDLKRAKAALEQLAGVEVLGYRAPNYSIGPGQWWAYEVLLEEGFRYDSSIYPIHHDRYGHPDAPRFPFEIARRGAVALIEFPIGTARVGGVNLPIGGGGYFRLMPTAWTRRGVQRVNEREGQPVMFYFHPWEMDPGQPRPAMPLHHRFRHYVNLDRFQGKLQSLLGAVRFAPVRDVLGLGGERDAATPAPAVFRAFGPVEAAGVRGAS